jgi:hypothetical protein
MILTKEAKSARLSECMEQCVYEESLRAHIARRDALNRAAALGLTLYGDWPIIDMPEEAA